MTIYIPLLYICMGLQCEFFQSEIYYIDEQKCSQEIDRRKAESSATKIEAICIDMEIKLEQKGKTDDIRRTGTSS